MKTLPRNYTVKDFRRATRKQAWPETSSSPGLNKLTYWQVYHVEFHHILKVLEVKTAKFLVGDFNGRCFFHGFSPSPTVFITHLHQVCFIFSILSWTYKVCMFHLFLWMSTFHCCSGWLYSRNSVLLKLTICLLFRFFFFGKRFIFWLVRRL